MFTNVVFSGASMRIVSLLGAYTYLSEKNIVKNPVNFVGSSAGALLAFMVACGLSTLRMKQILFDAIEIYKNTEVDVNSVLGVYTTLGIDDASAIENVIRKVLCEKFFVEDMTFLEFAKCTGKNLIICVSNITKSKAEYWCLDTVPDMSIIKALKASIAIPIIFRPIIHNNDVYCDGAIFDHLPLKGLTEYIGTVKFQNTIGICVQDIGEDVCPSVGGSGELNLVNYMSMIVNSLLKNINNESFCDSKKNNVIISISKVNNVDSSFDWNTLKFKMCKEDFFALLDHGYKIAEESLTALLFEQTFAAQSR